MRWIVAIGMSVAVSLLAYAMLDAQNSRVGESAPSIARVNMITVAGCLQQTEQGGASSDQFMLANAKMAKMESMTGAERNGSSTNAQTGNTPGANAPAADAAPSDAPMRPAASSYTLHGSTEELKRHVNHQVEITGTLEANGSTASDSKPSAATSDQRSSTSEQLSPATSNNHPSSTDNQPSSTTSGAQPSNKASNAQTEGTSSSSRDGGNQAQGHLAVQSVRMISANCSNP